MMPLVLFWFSRLCPFLILFKKTFLCLMAICSCSSPYQIDEIRLTNSVYLGLPEPGFALDLCGKSLGQCSLCVRVVYLSFITCTHQKIKALFCCINFDYMTSFVKKCFVFHFFSFEYKKRKAKYTLNSIVLQNLL